MNQTTLTCILCPMSCSLNLTVEEGRVIDVKGNSCKLGPKYAEKEITAPTRTLTSTVRIKGSIIPRLPVKTREEVPKSKILDCMAEINRVEVTAPVYAGQVIIANVAGTGVDVIATRDLPKA